MADRIVISGVRRYDGEYDLDLVGEPLTTLEWRWIKKISGYLPMTVDVGWQGRDPDLILALAVISLNRSGKVDREAVLRAADDLAEQPTAAVRLEFDDEAEEVEGDAPKAEPSETEPRPDGGEPSSPTSDPPGSDPKPTGTPDSPRSATSDHLTLAR